MSTEAVEPTTFKEYVERSDIGDLGVLAFMTGVSATTLNDISNGTLRIDEAHEGAITKVLPDLPRELLHCYKAPKIKGVKTKRGSAPEGCRIMLVPAGELEVGDLLAWHRPKHNGWWWVEVTKIERVGKMMRTVHFTHSTFSVDNNRTVRLARRV